MTEQDIPAVAEIHAINFPRQHHSERWIQCAYQAKPRAIPMVFERDHQVLGFAIWMQKAGFRKEAVVELELFAVTPTAQGQGIGRSMLKEALPLLRHALAEMGASLKHILITTRNDNHAKALYQSALGAEEEAIITNLYSADEVLLIARNL
nr:GNAT family N-acetyltransferase [Thaumasiovibrio subtropicus]